MSPAFDRDTWLDALVNLVPLGILAFFLVLYLVFDPWGSASLLGRALQVGLIVVPFVLLAYLTVQLMKRI